MIFIEFENPILNHVVACLGSDQDEYTQVYSFQSRHSSMPPMIEQVYFRIGRNFSLVEDPNGWATTLSVDGQLILKLPSDVENADLFWKKIRDAW